MSDALKEQIEKLTTLSDADLTRVVSELSKMLSFEVPKRAPGMSKERYLEAVRKSVKQSTLKLSDIECRHKSDEIVAYASKQNPGLWKRIIANIREFSLLTFTNRSN